MELLVEDQRQLHIFGVQSYERSGAMLNDFNPEMTRWNRLQSRPMAMCHRIGAAQVAQAGVMGLQVGFRL